MLPVLSSRSVNWSCLTNTHIEVYKGEMTRGSGMMLITLLSWFSRDDAFALSIKFLNNKGLRNLLFFFSFYGGFDAHYT